MKDKDIFILGIESSCDETSVAVVKNGREVLTNAINSQIKIHEEYGGVVPEIASRCHIEVINQITKQALKEAKLTLEEIDAIAVTRRTGIGRCIIGWRFLCQRFEFCEWKTVNCSQSHCGAHCSQLFDASRFRTTIFVFDCFRWTYAFGERKKLQ